jgi:N-acetylglucosamine kinase-like BadF-type ATPase
VQRVNATPPVALAALAPLVMRGYDESDATAIALVRAAADHLVSTVHVVREPSLAGAPEDASGEDSPIVLAGGLLATDCPLGIEVRSRLAEDWPAAPRPSAGDGAAAAAWLATRDLAHAAPADAHVHARLVDPSAAR